MVVDYVTYCRHIRVDLDRPIYEELLEQLIPLLWVCGNFRTYVYSFYCTAYELDLLRSSNEVHATRESWPHRLRKIDYPTHHLAKELEIRLDPTTTFTGIALQQLSLEPYSGCSFPLARTLEVRFHPKQGLEKNCPIGSATIEANIGAFMDRLRQMAPKVREVKILHYHDVKYLSKAAKLHFGSLVTQLHQLAKRMQFHNYTNKFTAIQVDSIRDLAYLHCTVSDVGNLVVQMAQRNASTLQDLILTIHSVTNVSGLIRDTDG
ncbi:hypothetical protein GGI00_006475, partial [Coemansia sp. RSA 2681]